MEKNCLNCKALVIDKYCSNCGQSSEVGRITFKETFQGFLSSAFSLEGPLLFTLKHLFIRPGVLIREFLSGKRKTYYKPVALYILSTAVYLILKALIDYDPLAGQMPQGDQANSMAADVSMQAARFMVDNINNIMFFLVLSIGLVLKLFFWKRYNLAEYVTVGFYIASAYTLIGTVEMFFSKYSNFDVPQLQLLFLFILVFYYQASIFQKRSFGSLVKYFFASLLSVLFYLIVSFGFSLAYIILLK